METEIPGWSLDDLILVNALCFLVDFHCCSMIVGYIMPAWDEIMFADGQEMGDKKSVSETGSYN